MAPKASKRLREKEALKEKEAAVAITEISKSSVKKKEKEPTPAPPKLPTAVTPISTIPVIEIPESSRRKKLISRRRAPSPSPTPETNKTKEIAEADTRTPQEQATIRAHLDSIELHLNQLAHSRFVQRIQSRNFIKERGFDMKRIRAHHRDMWENIHYLDWDEFCDQPERGVVPVVREFYIQASESQERVINVRGCRIDYTAKALNRWLGLEDASMDDFKRHLKTFPPSVSQGILDVCCEKNAEWGGITRTNYSVLEQKYLNDKAKMWYMFICARLAPTTHVGQLTKTRAVILWYIMTRKALNVGELISDDIFDQSRVIQGSLGFPSLITALCRSAGATIEDNEEVIPTRSAIMAPPVARTPKSKKKGVLEADAGLKELREVKSYIKRLADYTVDAVEALSEKLNWMHKDAGYSVKDLPMMPARLNLELSTEAELFPPEDEDENTDDDE